MKPDLLDGDEVVISGVGCHFPEAYDLSQLAGKLFAEDISLSENNQNDFGIPKVGPRNFDYTFFGMTHSASKYSNKATQLILERTFEAVIDAGINPIDIKGSNGPVFSSLAFLDSDVRIKMGSKGGQGVMAKSRSFEANRVSYWLDLKGASVSYYDRGMQNIFKGWESIRNGSYDTAVVCSANLKPEPETRKQMDDSVKVSPEGKCKSYDDSADGWSPSDGVVVFVLQRAKIAKRCYAVIEHAMFQFHGDLQTVFNKPCQQYWESMLKEFYSQSKINPKDVYYIEGHGAGIKEDDTEELNALTSVFCKNRTTPLLLGSVKSNLGYMDSASASCGILKAIISFERGIIPKNLHYNSPNASSSGLKSGKIQVVNKHTQIPSNSLIGVNSYCFGGMYGHLVLRGNPKPKRTKYDGIPRLVPLSVRQDEYFDDVVNKLEAEPFDVDLIGLLHGIFSNKMEKYLSRGYTILPKLNDMSIREHQVYDDIKRPVWFIFSGMGSQWSEMGKRLMDLPMFRSSIEKSHAVLKKKGLNLIDIITTDDPTVFDNILHSFVGIAAIQIALVDILNALGIVPDNIIGHSAGELGCSYADGCLTAEQTILCAYSRGKASIETSLIKGLMAAIGKGYNEIKDVLPTGIEVACHNSHENCTISGPVELIQNYVEELKDRKIFARTVNVSNIAYHSQYIKPAGPKLLEYLKEIIPEPKLRSEKWISTSISLENIDTDLAKYCSAEYHTNNLLSSVYFEEGIKKIPKNAICIEIAPHGLLQAILKRALPKDCINIPLTNRSANDKLLFFLQALGKMYIAGLHPKIQELYPSIDYPVSKGTSSLVPFIRWDHDTEFTSVQFEMDREEKYSLKDELRETAVDEIGYLIDGNNFYPFSVFIVLVWKTLASLLQKEMENCPVVFQNIRAENLKPVNITEADQVSVFIGTGTGQFEIFMDRTIATGTVSFDDNLKTSYPTEDIENQTDSKSAIYAKFDRKDYIIGKYLKNLISVETVGEVRRGKIEFSSDWLQTLESMIQLKLLDESERTEALLFPLSIQKLIISPHAHKTYKDSIKDEFCGMVAEAHNLRNIIKCGGIEMKGLQMQILPKISPKLKIISSGFVPFINPPLKDIWSFVDYCFGILKNNHQKLEINILEMTDGDKVYSFASYLKYRFCDKKLQINTELAKCNELKKVSRKYDLVISSSLEEATSLIHKWGFILAICPEKKTMKIPAALEEITNYSFYQDDFILLKKREILTNTDYIAIPDNEPALCSLIKEYENEKNKVVYLISYSKINEKTMKRLQRETSTQLRWIFILDKEGPAFDTRNPIFGDQLIKGLRTNIYFNESWGLFHRRNFTKEKFQLYSVFTSVNGELTVVYFGTDANENFFYTDKFKVEYSGELKNKTQVMGIATIRNKEFLVDDILQWSIPSSWTMEEGATLPLSHSLAYYYLKIVSNLEPCASVLVTDGFSVNGRATISVALALGLKVYVTVNEEKEIIQIRKLFPCIDNKDVVIHEGDFWLPCSKKYSESATLIVMNNLEEEKLASAMNNVPEWGTVFHFGKKDLQKKTELGMYGFLNSMSLYGTSSTIFDRLSTNEKTEIRDFIATGIKSGFIKPLPRTVRNEKEIGGNNISEIRSKTLFVRNNEHELNRCWIHPTRIMTKYD